ncbi:MAG: hypothetical protein KGJ34_02625 [Patescibacteria group bacterium]|nr:hypothetical protein [Patescibacteria group bacterium]
MFSLRSKQPFALYAEWAIFAVLLLGLIALLWFIEFGTPQSGSSVQSSSSSATTSTL